MKILYSYANLSKTRCFLEKFTQLAQILHDRRSRQPWQISSLRQRKLKAPQRVNSLKMRTHKHMVIRNFHHSRLWWYKYTYISEVMIRFSELQLEEAMKIGVAFFGSQRLWVYVWKDFWELFNFLGEEKSDRKSKHGCVKPSSPFLAMPIISVHHTTATTPLLFNNQHGSFLVLWSSHRSLQ